ncbi:MAG: cytochrome-c oxidase, cbb3-type subunit I, partial [Pseudomonadota bacterium]
MGKVLTLATLGLVAVIAAMAANFARDAAYQVNAIIVLLTALGYGAYIVRTMDRPAVVETG